MRAATLVCFGLSLFGCYDAGDSSPETPKTPTPSTSSDGLVPLRGKVADSKTNAPIAGALVFVEVGGRYLPNPDPSKGHPDYRYVGLSDDQGAYEIRIPAGKAGIHSFKDGYRYGSDLTEDAAQGFKVPSPMEANLAADVKPFAGDFKVEPASVAAGASITFTATLRASGAADPMSEEVLVGEPVSQWARAMDPPTAGVQGKGFPDGTWKTVTTAPAKPGTYKYYLVSSSEKCITSDRLTVELVVK